MNEIFKVTRRDFLRQTGIGAGALVLGTHLSPGRGIFAEGTPSRFQPNHFVAIEKDGTVVIIAQRSEMGQGIRSSLPAVLADELEADWARVVIRQADADAHKYGVEKPFPQEACPTWEGTHIVTDADSQYTDSSRSMAAYFQPMRIFGATARQMLVEAAAETWGVDAGECQARQHEVRHPPSNRSLGYGELVERAAAKQPPHPTQVKLKEPGEWRYIGRPTMPFFDARDMVTGKAVYGADVDLPGMLTAMIVRCPVANGQVWSFDPSAALAVPGVVSVERILPGPEKPAPPTLAQPGGGVGTAFLPHAGVAVLAENTWAALKGRRKLKIEWTPSPYNDGYDSSKYREELKASTSTSEKAKVLRHRGDVDAALAHPGHQVVAADYYVPHLAQAPMEPPVAIALFDGQTWEIWAPTQGPQIAQQAIGQILLQIPPERWEEPEVMEMIRSRVKVHVTLLGGGFGRKSKPDYMIEAALLAARHPGVPIRVQWTREDDIQFSYFHAVSNQHLEASLDGDKRTTGWLQRSAFPSLFATLFPPAAPKTPFAYARAKLFNGGEYPYGSSIEVGQGLEDVPFDIDNLRLENCPADSHIRVGWMRSVSNIFHAFAVGSFADELAIAAGKDSKSHLLELIGEPRVLELDTEGVSAVRPEWYPEPAEDHYNNNFFPYEPCPRPLDAVMPGYGFDTGRLSAVIRMVAEKAGWDRKVAEYGPRRGLGIAAHRSFLSYVAIVVDVSLSEFNELKIHEVHGAIDCGVAVNPDRVIAQMEGGIVYALSLALHGEITVKKGAVEQHNFDDYPVLRLYQTPRKIATHIMPSAAPPTGVGEPPVPPLAPALCNAIVAAGGPRIRELPIWKHVEVL